jgi:hypothetical protein
MELQHFNIKIFVEGDFNVDRTAIIAVFHDWVREQSLGELLIDVADYRHVPNGPGILVIGHQADYSMDHTDGRWGLRYNRKAPQDGTNDDRLRQSIVAACHACRLLETHFKADGPLRFERNAFQIVVNDRALAPNTTETLEACQIEWKRFLTDALGHSDFHFEKPEETRKLVGVRVTAANPFDVPAKP